MLLYGRSFTRISLLKYVLLAAPGLVIEFWLERIGRPQFDANGSVRRTGEDLDAKGLTEYLWDVLYWTWGCIVLAAILGDWAWWTWIAIPAYSAWLAWTTYTGMRGGLGGLGGGAETADTPEGGSKRQKKMEKRGGQKVVYR